MDFDDMDHMPEWEHFNHFEQEDLIRTEEEEIKYRAKTLRAKKLYDQARAIYRYSALFCETLDGEMAEMTANLIMQNAMMLCPKIVGAEGGDLYIIRMENASIIRTNCKELETQVKAADMFEICTPEYKDIVLSELDKFKTLFMDWVRYFEKDDYLDEWGLY